MNKTNWIKRLSALVVVAGAAVAFTAPSAEANNAMSTNGNFTITATTTANCVATQGFQAISMNYAYVTTSQGSANAATVNCQGMYINAQGNDPNGELQFTSGNGNGTQTYFMKGAQYLQPLTYTLGSNTDCSASYTAAYNQQNNIVLTGNGNTSIPLYVCIAGAQYVAGDVYTDTVTATLSF